MTRQRISLDDRRLHLCTIILVTLLFYAGTLTNFLYADDFIWLDRVTHLAGNWQSIFTIENRYFTPLTYLSFSLNHKLFGLDPFWYHLHDAMVHALNGCLLYLLAFRISRSRMTALIAAVLFVTSFAIVITVLWSSARTDLIMVFFSLATMNAFGRGESRTDKLLPLLLYLLALGAKGTALVIPFILFFLTPHEMPFGRRLKQIAPYLALNVAYTALLLLSNSLGAKLVDPSQKAVSFANFARSLPTLVIPERYLADIGMPALVILSVAILGAMCAMVITAKDAAIRIGTALTVFGLLPLLFTREYALAGSKATAIRLLSSPSNRVYLACAGIALLYAVLFERFAARRRHRAVRMLTCTLLLVLLGSNYQGLRVIGEKWRKGTKGVSHDMAALESNREMLTENSVLLLFNFEGSTGFSKAMINAFYDLHNVEVHTCDSSYTDELTDVDRSPLNNPQYDFAPSGVKLILDCPGNPYIDTLVADGNRVLQKILADYRQLYSTSDIELIRPARKRLDDNMAELRSILNYCTTMR